MACCKPCCGCKDCAEGEQGKCCCGGAGGTCCNVGEFCCSGACQPEPCNNNCDMYQDWTLEASFCGETLIYSSDGVQNNSPIGFRLNFSKPDGTGGCCSFGIGSPCDANGNKWTGPNGGYICTGTDLINGLNCSNQGFGLELNEGQCTGRIEILAVGPSGNCDRTFCVRYYQADILNGNMINVNNFQDGTCGCDDELSVILNYAP